MSNISNTILAVDDDLEDLELLEEMIMSQKPGAIFRKLSDGSKVLPFLEALDAADLPCLIILDYNMPEMNGAQVLAHLCKVPRYKPIPKFMLSTSNAPAHIKECMNNGALKYFVKPSSMKEFQELVKEMITVCDNYISTGK